jgi:hypothetical protein
MAASGRPKTHIPEEEWARMKDGIKFRKEDLDRLVMDYLVTEVRWTRISVESISNLLCLLFC